MGNRRCLIKSCSTSTRHNPSKVNFHQLPSNHELRQKWLSVYHPEELRAVKDYTGKSTVICGLHFDKESYKDSKLGQLNYALAIPKPLSKTFPGSPLAENGLRTSTPFNLEDSRVTSLTSEASSAATISALDRSTATSSGFDGIAGLSGFDGTSFTTSSFDASADMTSGIDGFISSELAASGPNIPLTENQMMTECAPVNKNQLEVQQNLLKERQELLVKISNLRKSVRTLDRKIGPDHSTHKRKAPSDELLNDKRNRIKRLRSSLAYYKKKNETLKQVVQDLRSKYQDYITEDLRLKLVNILEDQSRHELHASVLFDQIINYKNKSNRRNRWSQATIKHSIILSTRSPGTYRFMRTTKMLNLPHVTTLRSYVGSGGAATGVTSLVRQRLAMEYRRLEGQPKLGSLIIDEMSIKPSLQFIKKLDQYVGMAENANSQPMESAEAIGVSNRLADKILAFTFTGLSSRFAIPVAYFLVKDLTAEQLLNYTLEVIREVEKAGFFVVRVVTDNLSTNVKLFKLLGDGKRLFHIVPHPVDPPRLEDGTDRPRAPIFRSLFLSFDYCHILKNIRNQFIDRKFKIKGEIVTFEPIIKLYEIQRRYLMKPVRNLTRRIVNPNKMERMKVGPAVTIFSPELVAAIKLMSHYKLAGFENTQATIDFLTTIRKWWDCHDVCNTSAAIRFRQEDRRHFCSIEDERLEWLKEDFIKFLQDWKKNATPQTCLTSETYEALLLTSRSTADSIQYLLNNGFLYVLTRKFSSDEIERLFGAIRQTCGGNDRADAHSSIRAFEKILRTGITYSSINMNVDLEPFVDDNIHLEKEKCERMKKARARASEILENLPGDITSILQPLKHSPVPTIPALPEAATVDFTAGYVIRTLIDHDLCKDCIEKLVQPSSRSQFFISVQDRGALIYPSAQFVAHLWVIYKFIVKVIPKLEGHTKVLDDTVTFLTPYLLTSPLFQCETKQGGPNEDIVLCTLYKFLSPIFRNYAGVMSDLFEKRMIVDGRFVNRKYLKL